MKSFVGYVIYCIFVMWERDKQITHFELWNVDTITKAEYYKSLISGDCNLAVSSTIYKGNGEKEK